MRVVRRWTVGSAMLLLAACGQTVAPVDQDAALDLADDVATDDGLQDGASEEVADLDIADVGVDAPLDATADAAPDTEDTADVVLDVGECAVDGDCATKVTLSACQLPKCTVGVCSAVKNPDACCLDADCDDGNECNTHKCDQQQHKCTNAAIANCCSGKVLLQNAGFESGQDGFVATEGAGNGNVSWQSTTYRAHGGKQSLYFGNPCHSYDNSMTTAGACKPLLSDTLPVSTTLLSKTWLLPKDKKAQAHFWLWLDTEPPYTKSIPAGLCDPPCNPSSSCIEVAGASVCEPEKDLLSLQVLAQDAPPATVFWSTQIGKTTQGDAQNPSGWRHIAVDLANWQGKSIQLAWQFNTKTNAKNGYEGIYLDDVIVETICPDLGKILCGDAQKCDDDGLTCTSDSCTGYSNASGQGVCFHDNIAACCLGDADCDDGNTCTIDTCSKNVCKSLPDASQPGCCKPSTLQTEDFNNQTLTGWVNLGLNSVNVFWRVNPKGGEAGSGALTFANAIFTAYDDQTLFAGEGPHGTVCAKPIQLQAGTNYKLLNFSLNMDTEWSDVPSAQYVNPPIPGASKLDWFSVQVLSGGVADTIWSSDAIFGTTAGKWLPVTVPLDAYAGKSVQVCLHFDAGDGTLNDKPGVNIDNLSVTEACEKADCYWSSECAAKSCAACQTPVCTASTCVCQALSNCP